MSDEQSFKFSHLELVLEHDVTANAPERDRSSEAPEVHYISEGPQVSCIVRQVC